MSANKDVTNIGRQHRQLRRDLRWDMYVQRGLNRMDPAFPVLEWRDLPSWVLATAPWPPMNMTPPPDRPFGRPLTARQRLEHEMDRAMWAEPIPAAQAPPPVAQANPPVAVANPYHSMYHTTQNVRRAVRNETRQEPVLQHPSDTTVSNSTAANTDTAVTNRKRKRLYPSSK